jgi:hypothetical protein
MPPSMLTRDECERLRWLLRKLLPAGACVAYERLEGGLFGDRIDEVLQFALIAFLDDRVTTLPLFSNHEQAGALRRWRDQ